MRDEEKSQPSLEASGTRHKSPSPFWNRKVDDVNDGDADDGASDQENQGRGGDHGTAASPQPPEPPSESASTTAGAVVKKEETECASCGNTTTAVTGKFPKEPDGIVPKRNRDYENREYWDERFAVEETYEWLLSFDDLRDQIVPLLRQVTILATTTTPSPPSGKRDHDLDRQVPPPTRDDGGPRILVLGCGNSSFTADLYDAGFRNVVSIDFSETVIRAMAERHSADRPELVWMVADLTDLSSDFEGASFDAVLDKATIDAVLAGEGDVWNPCDSAVNRMRSACRHVSRVLRPGGIWIQVSLAQPQFRIPYLLGRHGRRAENRSTRSPPRYNDTSTCHYSDEFGWTVRAEAAGVGPGGRPATFGHFMYVVEKDAAPPPADSRHKDKDEGESSS